MLYFGLHKEKCHKEKFRKSSGSFGHLGGRVANQDHNALARLKWGFDISLNINTGGIVSQCALFFLARRDKSKLDSRVD